MTIPITQAIDGFLQTVQLGRSENTSRTYCNALRAFQAMLLAHEVDPLLSEVTTLPEDSIVWLVAYLKDLAPTTERLYIQATSSFFEYLVAEKLADINLPRVKLLIRQRARRPGQRLPQFSREGIEKVLEYADKLPAKLYETPEEHLRNLRDRAFLITLADTGMRVHEACKMRRGDLDWNESRAIIIGKGNKQAVVRFTQRAQSAIRDYLNARANLDGSTGKPLSSLPLFVRHDLAANKILKPMTTATGRNIVTERVREVLGPAAVGTITPHSFRHYFVTKVLRSSGNLKLAQELARHASIVVTQRYAHLSDNELDQGYYEIFEKDND